MRLGKKLFSDIARYIRYIRDLEKQIWNIIMSSNRNKIRNIILTLIMRLKLIFQMGEKKKIRTFFKSQL